MATPKGNIGYSVIGDSSVEFYRNLFNYVNDRIDQYGARIFQARVLNKPTVFVCSASGVHELLTEHYSKVNTGYKALLHHLYGDNIMFEESTEANRLHALMHHVFIQNGLPNFEETVQKYIHRHFSQLHTRSPVQVYDTCKQFATELMLALFLEVDVFESPELVKHVTALATTHWHGLISVPLSLKFSSWSSSYTKAVQAKEHLLGVIRDRLANHCPSGSFLDRVQQAGFKDQTEVEQHILPFVSALVPKAIASLLASFVLAMCTTKKQEHMQEEARERSEFLDWCLLEAERLWPPVIGGRRLVAQDFVLQGYKIPKGYAVFYISSVAHRDPKVFKNPETYDPNRWAEGREQLEKTLYCYGAGPRCCVGTSLMRTIIKTVSEYLVKTYRWSLTPDQESLDYKWLPMARPKELLAEFTRLDQSEDLPAGTDPDVS